MRTPPPSSPEMTRGFLMQLLFCKNKSKKIHQSATRFLGATPPKKNPGSAHAIHITVVEKACTNCKNVRVNNKNNNDNLHGPQVNDIK